MTVGIARVNYELHKAYTAGAGYNTLQCNTVLYTVRNFTMASQWASCRLKSHGLFNRLLRLTSKKTSKPALPALCERNPPMTGGFPSQRASNTESFSMAWLLQADKVISHKSHLELVVLEKTGRVITVLHSINPENRFIVKVKFKSTMIHVRTFKRVSQCVIFMMRIPVLELTIDFSNIFASLCGNQTLYNVIDGISLSTYI